MWEKFESNVPVCNMMISMITIHNFRNLPHKMQQAFLYEEYILFVHLTMLETTDLVRSDTALQQ